MRCLTYVSYDRGQNWICDGEYSSIEEAYDALDHACYNGADGCIDCRIGRMYRIGNPTHQLVGILS